MFGFGYSSWKAWSGLTVVGIIVFCSHEGLARLGVPLPSPHWGWGGPLERCRADAGHCHQWPGARGWHESCGVCLVSPVLSASPSPGMKKLLLDLEENIRPLGNGRSVVKGGVCWWGWWRRGLWCGWGSGRGSLGSLSHLWCGMTLPVCFPVARRLGERGAGGMGCAPHFHMQRGKWQHCWHHGYEMSWLCWGRPCIWHAVPGPRRVITRNVPMPGVSCLVPYPLCLHLTCSDAGLVLVSLCHRCHVYYVHVRWLEGKLCLTLLQPQPLLRRGRAWRWGVPASSAGWCLPGSYSCGMASCSCGGLGHVLGRFYTVG